MEFIHCVWSWARSYHDEGAVLAFLRLLCRTSLNLSCSPPHLQAPQDSWPCMMSFGSLPSDILMICPPLCSWADNTMVETAGIPGWERTAVLGTLSFQVIFIREHRWCCCSWSIWHMCLMWTPHHASIQQCWYDNGPVCLVLGGQLDVLLPDEIFQLARGKAGYCGSWVNLQSQRSWCWHYAAQVAELSEWIEMSVINKESWFYIAWARSQLVQKFCLFQANSQSKVISCTGKMAGDLL